MLTLFCDTEQNGIFKVEKFPQIQTRSTFDGKASFTFLGTEVVL
jgi:hypothetical protein